MRTKLLLLIAGILLSAAHCHGQTNQWYPAGEIDVQAAPVAWLGSTGRPQYGISVESRYWENAHIGTGLQFGNDQIGRGTYPGITYLSTLQYYRFAPFSSSQTWGRLQLGTFTGAEHWVNDGATGIPIGGVIDFAITRRAGIDIKGAEHFATEIQNSGLSLQAALQIKF